MLREITFDGVKQLTNKILHKRFYNKIRNIVLGERHEIYVRVLESVWVLKRETGRRIQDEVLCHN